MHVPKISTTEFPSPAKTICRLLLVLFSIEIVIMFLLPGILPEGNPYLMNLVDSLLLSLFFAPVLYHFIFRPFQEIATIQTSLTESVMAHVVDGVVVLDENLSVKSFNTAAERLFGYSAAGIVGTEATMILGDELKSLCRSQETDQPSAVVELAARRSDGGIVPVEVSLSEAQIGGHRLWLAIIRDISARKTKDSELKHTLSLLSATLESTADGIMVRDLKGNTVIYNKRFAEIWRIPNEVMETRNEKVMRAFVLEQLKDPQRFLELTEGQYIDVEQNSRDILNCRDGRVLERYSAPQVVDDEIVGRLICYRDVTEQTNLEHQLRHAQKMEALGTLAGGVAHDFNNILTVIMGFCNLTSVRLEEDSPLKANLDQIMSASERALTLTNSLLAYSRKQPINPVPLELNGRVQKIEKFLARLIGENVELVTTLCQEKLVVMADGGQLEQVLMNLSANARDAMNRRGCLIIATRRLDIGEDFVRLHGYGKTGIFAVISVSDTGAGMDEKTREKIFEPFFTTKPVGSGTGLGLSIVYGIVKQHGGFINVYSEPGRGTTFNIYLPVIEGEEEEPVNPNQVVKGGTETLLLAEDDAGVRALVKSILDGAGYQVIEARDGAEAVERFREKPEGIDLLILDVVMPRKNGKEALEEISAIRPTKALFLSGYTADIVDKNGLMESGGALLMKPLLPSQLLAKVREILDRN